MPNQDESLHRWQGKIDAFVENASARIETLFKMVAAAEKTIQLLDDELKKDIRDTYDDQKAEVLKLREDLNTLATKLSNLVARLTVIVALGSFVGTVVTSIFVATIIKIFLK